MGTVQLGMPEVLRFPERYDGIFCTAAPLSFYCNWDCSGLQAQDLAFISAELQEILVGLFFQLTSEMVPLASRLALQHISHFSWVGVICKLVKDALCLFDQVADEDVKQYQPFSIL
ncbi:hypothetical protein llap_5139 [Limosa lapponica baueri]|uniref:Uncharacterized protein n=1 Tax=Limosa lapponica baueri TaxID=1758121 RepID=A0A2I0UES4_LIMLA|nr:hypothetical protein llap_5139 [Limosa lapponica baueri]